jgi:hypothetical protein
MTAESGSGGAAGKAASGGGPVTGAGTTGAEPAAGGGSAGGKAGMGGIAGNVAGTGGSDRTMSSGGAGGEGGADAECSTPSDCDDANPCTTDACLLAHCSHTSNTTACTDDKDPCTADVCAVGKCTHPDNKLCACKKDPDCDDKNGCTDDHCTANACVHTNNTAVCADDNMSCTTDVCAAGACTHKDNGSCGVGKPFTVDSFNSSDDWLAAKTTPDQRAVVVTGADLTNVEGNADLFVAATAPASVELGLAAMLGLSKLRIVIKSAQANTGSMVFVGVWNGAAWTDKPLADYAAIPSAAYATIEVPTAAFGQPLDKLTKMRLRFAPAGEQKTWQIDEISAAK